jgi:anaerobic magnesium-protoporphyrin IX monomethyl ester cyclase
MRVLLINPPETSQGGFSNPPLGLAYLAGILEIHDQEVKISDGYLIGRDGILNQVREFSPQIIGITCYTPGRAVVLDIARTIKHEYPDIQIVLGGAHPTILWDQILHEYPEIDICVIGEGEITLLEIVQNKPLDQILGIAWRCNGQVVKNQDRPLFENLDLIPSPAWHLLELKKYPPIGSGIFNNIDLSKEPRIPVIFSRGCTAHCSFCSTWWIWRGHRSRSASNMTDELELLNRTYGVNHFAFEDDAFSGNIEAAKELCKEIINRKLRIAWYATTRVDLVDNELLSLMKQAGCYCVSYGIETGSQQLLNKMGKQVTVLQSKETLIATKKAGLTSTALLIVGNRGETDETINETVDFINQVNPNQVGSVGGLWIFPGTALYQTAKKEKIIDDSFWLTDQPIKVYLAEHSQSDLEKYLYAIKSRKKLGTLAFKFGFALEPLRKFIAKFPLIKKIYRKLRKKRY